MRYTSYTVIVDPTTFETRIYLRREDDEDGGMDDYLALDPAHADELSGTLIMMNAQRKREAVRAKGTKFADKFRRK